MLELQETTRDGPSSSSIFVATDGTERDSQTAETSPTTSIVSVETTQAAEGDASTMTLTSSSTASVGVLSIATSSVQPTPVVSPTITSFVSDASDATKSDEPTASMTVTTSSSVSGTSEARTNVAPKTTLISTTPSSGSEGREATTTDAPVTTVIPRTSFSVRDIPSDGVIKSSLTSVISGATKTGSPTTAEMQPTSHTVSETTEATTSNGSSTKITATAATSSSLGVIFVATTSVVPETTVRSASSSQSAISGAATRDVATTLGTTKVSSLSTLYPTSEALTSTIPAAASPTSSSFMVFTTPLIVSPRETWAIGSTSMVPSLSSCSKGYTGVNCSETDRCHPNPCRHGGTCKQRGNSYICECAVEYQGEFCENVKPAPKKYETTVSVQANYEPSYSDLDSSESRAFIENFTNKVEPFLSARLSEFRGIEVTRLSDGSVVVDFIILLEQNSNATTNAIVNALIDGNSTGELGVVLKGNISVQEITESFTTDRPRTGAREKDPDGLEKWIIVTIVNGAVVLVLILIFVILAFKYRRVVRARNRDKIKMDGSWEYILENQGSMRATTCEMSMARLNHSNTNYDVSETEMNGIDMNRV
ncbi:hypothetical protein ACROYT_G036506 [Oculina patagonica]